MEAIGLQWNLVWEEREKNFRRARELLTGARPARNSLVVLPEMFSSGFSMNVEDIAEGEGRPGERFLSRMAVEFGVYATGGVVQREGDGLGSNQSVSFSPAGRCVARYTKVHPFLKSKEGKHFRPGAEPVIWDWLPDDPSGPVKVSPFVCYDLRFPEVFRAGVRRGAEVFTVIACWPEARREHWRALLRARAIENQAYVIGINRTGSDPFLNYSGWSCVFDYFGNPVAEAGEGEEIVRATIDIEALRKYRSDLPFLADARWDLFSRE